MNAAISNYDDQNFEYRVGNRQGKPGQRPSHARRSRHAARRRAKAPTQFNGIHRRRKKKINW